MTKAYKTWATYSIAIFIAWAIVIIIRWQLKGTSDLKDLSLVFIGFFIGWLSATIKFVLISRNKHE